MKKTITNLNNSERYPKLTPQELEDLKNLLPEGNNTIIMAFRSDIRNFKEIHNNCFCVLTPFIIFIYKLQKKSFLLISRIHLVDIGLIAYSQEKHILLKTEDTNLVIFAEESLRLAQIFYRNYQFIISPNKENNICEIRSHDLTIFPTINIHLSPSQKFQLSYASISSLYSRSYHHEVVRFVHSMVLSQNGIFDISQLPLDIYFNIGDLKPIFLALDLMPFINGLCCSSLDRPNLLENISLMIEQSKKLKIIHFSNCNITNGLKQVHESIKSNSEIPISYWNLDGNKFKDFEYFPQILSISRSPLIYLSLNFCEIKSKQSILLFNILEQNQFMWNIEYLHISGIEMNDLALQTFDKFLLTLSLNNSSKLKTISIGTFKGRIQTFLNSLNKYKQPIENLNLSKTLLDSSTIEELIVLIKSSTSLKSLNISGTKINSDSITRIISTISENIFLQPFDIDLSELNLNGSNLLPIYRSFLDSDLNIWNSIKFENNKMNSSDLKNLLPLFQMMNNLNHLSLSFNFHFQMKDIGLILPDILKISNLKCLYLAGNEQFYLGEQLIPMLELIHRKPIEKLDISGNNIGNKGISSVLSVIRHSTTLKSVFLQNNQLRSMQVWTEMSEIIENNNNIIEFIYPLNDARDTVNTTEKNSQKEIMKRLSDLQMVINNSISSHRIQSRLGSYIPVESNVQRNEIYYVLNQLQDYYELPENYNIHSCICKEFNLPLPFQRIGDVVEDGGELLEIDIDNLFVYETNSMKYQIKENTNNFLPPQTINFNDIDNKIIPQIDINPIIEPNPIIIVPPPSNNNNNNVKLKVKIITEEDEKNINEEKFNIQKKKINFFVQEFGFNNKNLNNSKKKKNLEFNTEKIENYSNSNNKSENNLNLKKNNHKFLFDSDDND